MKPSKSAAVARMRYWDTPKYLRAGLKVFKGVLKVFKRGLGGAKHGC